MVHNHTRRNAVLLDDLVLGTGGGIWYNDNNYDDPLPLRQPRFHKLSHMHRCKCVHVGISGLRRLGLHDFGGQSIVQHSFQLRLGFGERGVRAKHMFAVPR